MSEEGQSGVKGQREMGDASLSSAVTERGGREERGGERGREEGEGRGREGGRKERGGEGRGREEGGEGREERGEEGRENIKGVILANRKR